MRYRWADFQAAQPALAATAERRFARYRHHVLATLRADGSPRLTGLEAGFGDGELWLGMMRGSLKALDLRRDPRFSLHANPGPGTGMDGGDVRVAGRAEEVTDPAEFARYAAHAAPDMELPARFHLFTAELSEVVRVRTEDPELVVEVWHPGVPLRVVRRGEEDGTREERG
jgi:hypothetical protein